MQWHHLTIHCALDERSSFFHDFIRILQADVTPSFIFHRRWMSAKIQLTFDHKNVIFLCNASTLEPKKTEDTTRKSVGKRFEVPRNDWFKHFFLYDLGKLWLTNFHKPINKFDWIGCEIMETHGVWEIVANDRNVSLHLPIIIYLRRRKKTIELLNFCTAWNQETHQFIRLNRDWLKLWNKTLDVINRIQSSNI